MSLREAEAAGAVASPPASATGASLCSICGTRPKLGSLTRCKVCLQKAADADRQDRAEAEARVKAKTEAQQATTKAAKMLRACKGFASQGERPHRPALRKATRSGIRRTRFSLPSLVALLL
jgi:hypothetical protein